MARGGVYVVKIGEIEVSVQKLSLKQVFLRTQIWIISLQGGLSWSFNSTCLHAFGFLFVELVVATRFGHVDVSANAHWCASSAYCTKRVIPFLTHKLRFSLRFFKSLGPQPQVTNINYVESAEVSLFCVEYLSNYLFQELYNVQCTSISRFRSWDITPKHTLERIQANAMSSTIPRSNNPTHAHQ